MKTIVCFGDSNTHGYNAENGGRFELKDRWFYLLNQKLGHDYCVIEEGMSGRTTCFDDPLHESMAGIEQIYSVLMSHEPVDLLVVMLGTNDTKERFNVSGEAISIAMERLLKKATSINEAFFNKEVKILLVTPKNIEKNYEKTACALSMGMGCAEKSEKLGKCYKELAERLSLYYLDANDYVKEYNKIDYMHLTKEGNKQLASALADKIKVIFNDHQ